MSVSLPPLPTFVCFPRPRQARPQPGCPQTLCELPASLSGDQWHGQLPLEKQGGSRISPPQTMHRTGHSKCLPSSQSPSLLFWAQRLNILGRLGACLSSAHFPSRIQAEKRLGVTRAPEECKTRNSAQQSPLPLTQLRKNPNQGLCPASN